MPGGGIMPGGIIPGGMDPGGGAIPAPIGIPGPATKLVVPPGPALEGDENPPGGVGGEKASRGSIGPCPDGGGGVMVEGNYTCNRLGGYPMPAE